ncbi:MAG: hypothetical protein ACREQV_22855 [Candidatus Binatia bacterium]
MHQIKNHGLSITFVASFLAIGVPYWLIPYNKISLPGTLIIPGLLVVGFSALMLCLFGVARFWKVIGIIGSSVPAAVLARVLVETWEAPTSHNLWPFEAIIALMLGFSCALPGAIAGSLFARLVRRPESTGK